jgi:signal transduction histidine kinase
MSSADGSGIIHVAARSIVVLLPSGPETTAVHDALRQRGLIVHPCKSERDAEAVRSVSRFAVVDVAMAGGLDLLRRSAAPPDRTLALAVLEPGAPEEPALLAGAAATLHRPLDPRLVLLLVARLQEQLELRARADELIERNAANAGVALGGPISSTIAHEIRNPLASARLNVSLLRQADLEGGPRLSAQERREMLADVDQGLERIESIVATVTGLARGERPAVHRVELLEVVEHAVATITDRRRAWIELDGARVYGHASRGLLQQAVVNLVTNALDAVMGGANPRVLVRVYETPGEARVSVRDNGPGVPPPLRQRIFEPFFSTKGTKGTGLGLAISRQAVASMGGALTLSSETGLGACFRIRLPRASPDG